MADGRSMSTGRRHIASSDAAHRGFRPLDVSNSDGGEGIRGAFEAWQRARYITALDRNPQDTWGDENGENYIAPFVDAAWRAWKEAWKQALLTPSSRPPVEEGWRPIETAPKDGTAIVAYWGGGEAEDEQSRYGVTLWNEGDWIDPNDPEQSWTSPTHWQPLPQPPSPSHEAEGAGR